MLLYFAVAVWLRFGMGLTWTGKGVGLGALAFHLHHLHPGIWFGLKGGWLFVALALLSVYLRRQFLRLLVFLIPLGGVLLGGFVNGDLVRTTAYLLPAVFVSLHVLKDHKTDRTLAWYALSAFVISAITGTYNLWCNEITWFMPLPVQLLDWGINNYHAQLKAITAP